METMHSFLASGAAAYFGWFFTGAGVYEIGMYELKKDTSMTRLILGGMVLLCGIYMVANT